MKTIVNYYIENLLWAFKNKIYIGNSENYNFGIVNNLLLILNVLLQI